MYQQDLIQQINEKTAVIGVIGMGYVGLPLALTFVDNEFSVIGFDIDEIKIDDLNNGTSYISHIDDKEVLQSLKTGRFRATIDFSLLAEVDAILICVPTPLTPEREPDLSFVISTAETIARHLRKGHLIVLESTTYPGCTETILKPRLEANNLSSGKDFFLAYSPEREDPGNPEYATAHIPKVVGGNDVEALKLAITLYDQIVVQTVPVSSMEVAEAVKLTENVFRSVNIALVNELKMIYQKIGVDVWEVIEAAKTKPFGYMPFYPGPGLGGHCIPIDPFYLSWRAKQVGEESRFIELAGEINTEMPERVINILENALYDQFTKPLFGARILLMGLAYKKNVGDTRESPAFALIEIMEARGANVDYHDPFIAEIPLTREHVHLTGRRSVPLDRINNNYDALLICTDHDQIDYGALAANQKLIVDTRNAVSDVRGLYKRNKVVKA